MVWMDENTATTHLLAKRDLELPANMAWAEGVQEVVVLVTVDGKGKICAIEPIAGPPGLKMEAVAAVRQHWRYRPFLVDWRPFVARFPVTVRFFPTKQKDARRRLARAFMTMRNSAVCA
jgi:hypothetical protein